VIPLKRPCAFGKVLLAFVFCFALQVRAQGIKAVVLTGGHDYPYDALFGLFENIENFTYVHDDQEDDSEIFEDISGWDYDLIIMHNMGKRISEKRQQNFISLLEQGVGIVAIHHVIAVYTEWPHIKKILGVRYHDFDETIYGVLYPQSDYHEGIDINVFVKDSLHPITRGMSDHVVHDEVYSKMSYEPDNHVLLWTDREEIAGEALAWTRRYANANIFFNTLGHDVATLTDPVFQGMIARAIRWAADSPPFPLTGLKAESVYDVQVTLAWDPVTDEDADSIRICYGDETAEYPEAGDCEPRLDISSALTGHAVDGLEAGTTYHFSLFVKDTVGNWSNPAQIDTATLAEAGVSPGISGSGTDVHKAVLGLYTEPYIVLVRQGTIFDLRGRRLIQNGLENCPSGK
jgi:type 1 glutamine amidotransferase